MVAVLVPVLLAAGIGPAGAGAVPEPPTVADPRPAPGTVLAPGTVTVAALLGSEVGVAGAEVQVDGRVVESRLEGASGPAPEHVTVAADVALDPGAHVVEVTATGMDDARTVRRWTVDVGAAAITRLAGEDRASTAAAVARDAYPTAGSARAAVLARDDAPADALAGAPLAAAVDGPLLLAGGGEAGTLPEATAEELAHVVRAGGTVHLLGGTAALSADVAAAVRAVGLDVTRHAGEDRAGTAAAVAAELPPADTAVLASGADFPDALAASVPAAGRGWPVLLAGIDGLPTATRRALGDVRDVVLVGGPAVLPDAVLDEVRTVVPGSVDRIAGPTRADTAAAIATRFTPDPPAEAGGTVALASGAAFPDALAGAAHAAARGAPLLLTDAGLPAASAAALAAARPAAVVVYGGEAAVGADVVAQARTAAADGPDAPAVTALEPAAGTALEEIGPVTVRLDRPVDYAEAMLRLGEVEVPATVAPAGTDLVVTPGATPATAAGETVPLVLGARVTSGDDVRHVVARWTYRAPDPPQPSPEGFLVAPGGSEQVGEGPLRTFTVEVEPGAGHAPADVAAVAEAALFDPRSWTARGERSVQRIDDPAAASVRVVLASPATVDRFCGRVGLGTGGIYSCWDGRRAMLNLDRYDTGAAPFDADLATYRGYLVNHEVGHGFGYGHVGCPAAGALAPVMMQQTKGTGACLPNPWPYP